MTIVEIDITRIRTVIPELPGLPDGAAGSRSVISTSNGPIGTERVHPPVVVRPVEHPGENQPATTVTDLPHTAFGRATDQELHKRKGISA